MAQNKPINKLPIVTNPNITGYTIYEDGTTTSISTLGSITDIIGQNIIVPISGVTGLNDVLTGLTETKLDRNPPIISKVSTKIQYDSSGLVISGDTLTKEDIPPLDYYSLTGGTFLHEQVTGLTESFNTHTGDTYNPHNVTPEQIGVYTSGQTDSLLSTKSDTGHTHNYLPLSGGELTGSLSGTTFYGSGAGLYGIPASGVTGLDLDRITSGSNSAIMSNTGLTVNTGATFGGYITSLNVSGTSLNTGDERYSNLTPVPETIHGISSGTTFNNKTMKEMFDLLLYPELFPTLLGVSSTFTSSLSSLYEIGTLISSITFSSTFNRGSITPSYGTSGYRSGLPTQYNYTGSGLSNTISTSLTDSKTVNNYTVTSGYQNWTGSVTYSGGEQPLSSKGNNYNSPLSSGTTSTTTRTIEGVYPIYATSSSISTLTKQTLVSMLTGNNIIVSLVSESGGNKQKVEIPTSWVSTPTNRPLTAIQVLNTVSNQYEYPGGSASSSLLVWTVTDVTETVQGNTINYKRYTYNSTDRSSVTIKLIF